MAYDELAVAKNADSVRLHLLCGNQDHLARCPWLGEFELHNGINRVRRTRRQVQNESLPSLLEGNIASVKDRRLHNLYRQCGQHQSGALRCTQNMDVDELSVMSRNSVGSGKPWTTSRAVDTFPIQAEPLANFVQTRCLSRVNLAIGAWSHIEQHVAIASCGADQQLQELR